MLEVKNVSKAYGRGRKKLFALKDINIEVNEGDHLAIIGSNGSGKTTLINLITQLSQPTVGRILYDGHKLSERCKARFGLMLGNSIIYHRLTVRQNLDYFAQIYNVEDPDKRIDDVLTSLGIIERADDLVEHLSEGTKSKVAFARAIVHEPEILILDEPTNGVDPISTDILHWQIKKYKTVILSSHNLYEVLDVADKLLVLNQGEQVYFGSIEEFKNNRNVEDSKKNLLKMYKTEAK